MEEAASRQALKAKLGAEWTEFRAATIAELMELGLSDEDAVKEARKAEARGKARLRWGLDLIDRIEAAEAAADAAWARLEKEHEELDDEAFAALPEPPEEAALNALFDQVDDVILRGQFPRDLHFADV